MTADNDDLEDFIRLQKEKLSRERHGLTDDEKTRKQWDRSNQDQIKQSVKENIPIRSDTPEIPLVAKLGQHEEAKRRLAEEKRREYNDLVSKRGGDTGSRRRPRVSPVGGGALPGLRDSQSAKQRKATERNREYNEFLKSKQGQGRRGKPLNDRGNEGMTFPSEKQRPAQPARQDRTPPRPSSRNRATSPIQKDHLMNGALVPRIDLDDHKFETTASRDYVPYLDQRSEIKPAAGGASLPIDDRAAALKRKEEERNREYNEFLKSQGGKRGRQRETSPSQTNSARQRAKSVGAAVTIQEPRKGWGTPRYDDILETKRHQEASYRGVPMMRPAVSEGDLDQVEGTRKLDRLDDVLESNKMRLRSELYNGARRPRVTLDDDDWLDFYKSPSRFDGGLSRAYTTLDRNSFDAKADRVKSAPLRDQGLPVRSQGAVATSRDQYRLELEQQMKTNAENRRRERLENMAVNASGLTEITRQNVDLEYGKSRPADAPPANSLLQSNATLLGAAGQATLGPYNSPMDEAYYYYSRRDPLEVGAEMPQPSGYVPSVPGTSGQLGGARRQPADEPRTKVSFGPATSLTPRRKNDSDLATVAAIPILTENDQRHIAKAKTNNYQAELQRQIEENKHRKNVEVQQRKREEARLEAEIASYNPFGKGGGGAPLKDTQGNVYADLKQMHKHNVDPNAPRAPPPPVSLPVTTSIDIPASVYDSYLSPRQQQKQFTATTPRQTNAFDEPTFARGGHGIFGDPKTDAEKTAADRYKSELQLQIIEKKRREEERKALQKMEEEKEMKQIEDARLKMQREYEEEVRKQREKEENARRRNEELKLQAEEKRREAERLRREQEDSRRQPSRTLQELDRERVRLTLSPPIPALRKDDYSARRSPPVPALAKLSSARDDYDYDPPRATTRLDRAGSADVLNKLDVIRKQLQTERQRVENQLEKDKFQVDVFDPRLVKAAPVAGVPIVMSPPIVLSPRKSPEVDVFETAALHRAPVSVKRPPVDPVNADLLNEFNQYKNRDSDSRQKFRQLFPDQPTTSGALETQQLALLRHQEEQLRDIQADPQMGSKTMLKSESAYIDPDGLPVKPATARERRRKKKVQVESPTDIGSTTSLNADMNKKNESRLKKLRDMNDDDSLQDPDDILDRFMSRQQHQRPNSGTTLNDEEAWLKPSS